MVEEPILPFPRSIRPLKNARSTILLGSMAVIRDSDRWNDYVAALPREHHAVLFEAVAGSWIPVESALAHYLACDALKLPEIEQVANGRRTFDRAGTTVFGTVIKMAREMGVTPWTLLPHMQRFWDRGYDGGAVAVIKMGPKEARLEVDQCALCESRYYRNALRGLVSAVIGLFSQRVYLTERPRVRGPDSVVYRAQWV